jgi:hypothetical protein
MRIRSAESFIAPILTIGRQRGNIASGQRTEGISHFAVRFLARSANQTSAVNTLSLPAETKVTKTLSLSCRYQERQSTLPQTLWLESSFGFSLP